MMKERERIYFNLLSLMKQKKRINWVEVQVIVLVIICIVCQIRHYHSSKKSDSTSLSQSTLFLLSLSYSLNHASLTKYQRTCSKLSTSFFKIRRWVQISQDSSLLSEKDNYQDEWKMKKSFNVCRDVNWDFE